MNTALEILRRHQATIRSLDYQQRELAERIDAARAVVKEAETVATTLQLLQQRRRELLADQYLGHGDQNAIGSLENQLAEAERRHAAKTYAAEGAGGAIVRLQAEYDARAGEIGVLCQCTKALFYNAAVERVREALPDYRNAAKLLGEQFARVQALGLAADQFVDMQATPRRTPVQGGIADSFAVKTPMLSDLDPMDFQFDIGKLIQTEFSEARVFLSGE